MFCKPKNLQTSLFIVFLTELNFYVVFFDTMSYEFLVQKIHIIILIEQKSILCFVICGVYIIFGVAL